MPQMNKGGKFIFGKSLIREDGVLQIPEQAIREYDITVEGRVYLFTGSKSTGGFCVTRKGLLEPSKLGHILSSRGKASFRLMLLPPVILRLFLVRAMVSLALLKSGYLHIVRYL